VGSIPSDGTKDTSSNPKISLFGCEKQKYLVS